ncbi:tetratricopeptide repeat protein [Streptomyces fumanus]
MLISAVTGMGGVGKTALAVEAAHRARAEGWFPGGFLFVDLRGYDDDPATAAQAVLALLDAMGLRDTDLPPTTARQYDAYRALLAERRDRTLLVLDNASDPAQYLPLLPGTDHHRVLITSRDRPSALPVRVIGLGTLAPDESSALVSRALHDADERDDRAAREPDALRELTDLCGHLPLALQIAAAMLRHRRHRGIASLVTEIREAGDPAAVLDSGSPGTDLYGRSLVVGPVLETSYRRLPPDRARLLRLLSLAPAAETGTDAVAALADLDERTVLRLLDDLAAAHLVTPVREDAASGVRWRLHDLVRGFGAGVVAGNEGEAARKRVLDFYFRWADAATARLRWLPGDEEPERFGGRGQALAWLDGERPGLVAAVSWGREDRFAETAIALGLQLSEYFLWRRYFDDWITVSRAVQEAAAHRAGNRGNEAAAWNNLGIALLGAGRAEEAIHAHVRAHELYHTTRKRTREATVLNNLGSALWELGRAEEAINAHTRARDMSQAAEDRSGEAMAWNNLGVVLLKTGQVAEAIDANTRARDLYQALRNRHREAATWINLGTALATAGRIEEATEAYVRALEAYEESEDWYGQGQALHNLALAQRTAGRQTRARALYLRAADAYARAGAPDRAAGARAAAEALEK